MQLSYIFVSVGRHPKKQRGEKKEADGQSEAERKKGRTVIATVDESKK